MPMFDIKIDLSKLNKQIAEGRLFDSTLLNMGKGLSGIAVKEAKLNIFDRASALYRPWKNRKYKGNRLLFLTGTLHKAIKELETKTFNNGFTSEIGVNDVIYAARQYYGDDPDGSGILSRRYLDMIPDSMTIITAFLHQRMVKELN